MVETLPFVGVYNLVVGGLYAYVGSQVARRDVPEGGRLAHRMFILWWSGLAASSLLRALTIGLYLAGALHPTYHLAATQLGLLAVIAALLGLLHYMVHIYTGSARWFRPILVFYVLFYLAVLAFVASAWEPPTGFTDDGWRVEPLPQQDADTSPVAVVLLLLLLGPQIAAAVAFLRLAPRLDDPTPRYRVKMVGTAILVWFGVSLAGSLTTMLTDLDLARHDAWQVLSRVVGLGAVLTILAAYKPPAWVRRRYGVRPL